MVDQDRRSSEYASAILEVKWHNVPLGREISQHLVRLSPICGTCGYSEKRAAKMLSSSPVICAWRESGRFSCSVPLSRWQR